MPADPVAAGKKGGASKSPAKLAACRRNGFQKVKKDEAVPAPGSRENRIMGSGVPVFVPGRETR